jgi:predicted transcriptional regulator
MDKYNIEAEKEFNKIKNSIMPLIKESVHVKLSTIPINVLTIGGVLKRLRVESDLTMDNVLYDTGVHKAHLSRVESGKIMPKIDMIDKLLNHYGYSLAIIKKENIL